MKKLLFILFAGFLLSSASLSAQSFESAVGARIGNPFSASYKTFINASDAVEVYAGVRSWSRHTSIRVAGAYQIHTSFDLDGDLAPLQWYYGGGASVAFVSVENEFVGNGGVELGISGYLGLQYVFDDIPLELTLDWVPTLNIGSTPLNTFGSGNGALGARYILNY